MRVDEKEEWLYELCKKYGLQVEYSWGVYYIGFRVKINNNPDSHRDLVLMRLDIETTQLEVIEEIVLGYVLDNGL